MKRTSRCLFVDWKALNGAAHGKRKLIIRENGKHMFTCPVKICLHGDFKSTRRASESTSTISIRGITTLTSSQQSNEKTLRMSSPQRRRYALLTSLHFH